MKAGGHLRAMRLRHASLITSLCLLSLVSAGVGADAPPCWATTPPVRTAFEPLRVGCEDTTQIGLCDKRQCTYFPSDVAWCWSPQYCVFEGNCYDRMSVVDIDGDNRRGEICTGWKGLWADCDYAGAYWCEEQCLLKRAPSGESHPFGEYSRYGAVECCGDDEDEYYVLGPAGFVCCDNPADAVVSGRCARPKPAGDPEGIAE